jgi:hypothetical protein
MDKKKKDIGITFILNKIPTLDYFLGIKAAPRGAVIPKALVHAFL